MNIQRVKLWKSSPAPYLIAAVVIIIVGAAGMLVYRQIESQNERNQKTKSLIDDMSPEKRATSTR